MMHRIMSFSAYDSTIVLPPAEMGVGVYVAAHFRVLEGSIATGGNWSSVYGDLLTNDQPDRRSSIAHS